MKTFKEIYDIIISDTGEKYTIREVLRIFDSEGGNWVGSSNQLMTIGMLSYEITGIRIGECSGCKITAVRNLIRWLNTHEQTFIEQPKPKGRPRHERV